MNQEALQRTIERGETWFWSRSRKELWHKGETSGNLQNVVDIHLDCDDDTVLVEVEPKGPACHTGAYSCFGIEPGIEGVLTDLYKLIEQRKELRPEVEKRWRQSAAQRKAQAERMKAYWAAKRKKQAKT